MHYGIHYYRLLAGKEPLLCVVLQLQSHMLLHSTDDKLRCHQCLAGFVDKSILDRHSLTVHPQVVFQLFAIISSFGFCLVSLVFTSYLG